MRPLGRGAESRLTSAMTRCGTATYTQAPRPRYDPKTEQSELQSGSPRLAWTSVPYGITAAKRRHLVLRIPAPVPNTLVAFAISEDGEVHGVSGYPPGGGARCAARLPTGRLLAILRSRGSGGEQ